MGGPLPPAVAAPGDVPTLLRQLESRLLHATPHHHHLHHHHYHDEQEHDDQLSPPLANLLSYKLLLHHTPTSRDGSPGGQPHNHHDGHSDKDTQTSTKERLQALALELREARHFYQADALDLLVDWLLRSEKQTITTTTTEHPQPYYRHVFPSVEALSMLSLLASSNASSPLPLGRLAAGLLTRTRQTSTAPDAVLKALYRSKEVEVPYVPPEGGGGLMDNEKTQPDCVVYNESTLMDGVEEAKGLCGATLYPEHAFEPPGDDDSTHDELGEDLFTYGRVSSFLSCPSVPDVTLFSSLRPRRGVQDRVAARLRDMSLRLTLPSLKDAEPRDPTDAYLKPWARQQSKAAKKATAAASTQPPLSSSLPPPPPPPSPSQSTWQSVGWESTWDLRNGRDVIPMPAPLLTQDGINAFELALTQQLPGQRKAHLMKEHTLLEHIFHALNGIPSLSFTLDPVGFCMRPQQQQRARGRTTTCVAEILAPFAEAGTCYVRLEGLVECVRTMCSGSGEGGRGGGGGEGRSQVRQALVNALSHQLALFQAAVERERERQWQAMAQGEGPTSTLLQVLMSTKSLRSRLIFLARLFHCFPSSPPTAPDHHHPPPWSPTTCLSSLPHTSVDLLSFLFHQAHQADAAAQDSHDTALQRSVLLALLEGAAAPYMTLLSRWVYEGYVSEAEDPFHEFSLRVKKGLSVDTSSSFSSSSSSVDRSGSLYLTEAFDDGDGGGGDGSNTHTHADNKKRKKLLLPPFISEALAERVVMAGKLLHLLSQADRGYYRGCAPEVLPRLLLVGKKEEGKERGEEQEGEGEGLVTAEKIVGRLVQQRKQVKASVEEKEVKNKARLVEEERNVIRGLEANVQKGKMEAEAREKEDRQSLREQMEERKKKERESQASAEKENIDDASNHNNQQPVIKTTRTFSTPPTSSSIAAPAAAPASFAEGRTPSSSFSGKRIVASPGGSSHGMAAVLKPIDMDEKKKVMITMDTPSRREREEGESETAAQDMGSWFRRPEGKREGEKEEGRSAAVSLFSPSLPPEQQPPQEQGGGAATNNTRRLSFGSDMGEGEISSSSNINGNDIHTHNENGDGEGHRRSSFSGKLIVQEPGGSSQRLASFLWGERKERIRHRGGGKKEEEGEKDGAACLLETIDREMAQQKEVGDAAGGGVEGCQLQWEDPLAVFARMGQSDLLQEEEEEDVCVGMMMGKEMNVAQGQGTQLLLTPSTAAAAATADDTQRQQQQQQQQPPPPHGGSTALRIHALEKVLHRQCALIERASVAFFMHEAHLGRHISALRRYLLGADTALLKEFITVFQTRVMEESSSTSSTQRTDWSRPSNILACFNTAVAASGHETDPCLSCFTYVLRHPGASNTHTHTLSGGGGGGDMHLLDNLEPQYQPPWPLGVVLPQSVLCAYAGVHRFLLRLHWLVNQLQRSRERVRAASKNIVSVSVSVYVSVSGGGGNGRERGRVGVKEKGGGSGGGECLFRTAHALLHRLAAVAGALLEHMAAQIEGDCWGKLQEALARVSQGGAGEQEGEEKGEGEGVGLGEHFTVLDLRELHAEYVREVAAKCFVEMDERGEEKQGEEGEQKKGKSKTCRKQSSSYSSGSTVTVQQEIDNMMAFVSDACGSIEGSVLFLLSQQQQQHTQAHTYTPTFNQGNAALARTLTRVRSGLHSHLLRLSQGLKCRRVEEASRTFRSLSGRAKEEEEDEKAGAEGGNIHTHTTRNQRQQSILATLGGEYSSYLMSRVEDLLEVERHCGV